MEFSSLVWSIPLMLLAGVIIAFTFNHNKKTTRLNINLALTSFLLSLAVMVERYTTADSDYGYYLDWFVLDNFYYRIGYELNYITTFFLVLCTGLNLALHLINRMYKGSSVNSKYSYLNLVFGLLAAIIMSDNILTYYILSYCIGVALFLMLAEVHVKGMMHTLRVFSKMFVIGHLLFLSVLLMLFYYQPNHAVEFTVIDSSLSIQPDLLKLDEEWVIGLLIVLSTIFTSTVLVPFERHLRENSVNGLVTVYVLSLFKVLLPAYLLIRFEALIRIHEWTESIVIVLGALLLLWSLYKLKQRHNIADLLLNISNAMLGMLYFVFSLETKLVMALMVLVYILTFFFSTVLVIFKQRKYAFNVTLMMMGISLFVPLIIIMSLGQHTTVVYTQAITPINLIILIGAVVYSIVISVSLLSMNTTLVAYYTEQMRETKWKFLGVVLIVFVLTVTLCYTWWFEFSVVELKYNLFDKLANAQPFIIIGMTSFILLLMLVIYIGLKKLKREPVLVKKNEQPQANRVLTLVKQSVVELIVKIDYAWQYFWENGATYIFRKVEQFVTAKVKSTVKLIVMMWSIAIVIAVLMLIIRG